MVGWHHRLSGHDFEQALGDSERQRSLAYCSPGVAKIQTQLNDEQQQSRNCKGVKHSGIYSLRQPISVDFDLVM